MDDEAELDASIRAVNATVGASPVTGECVGSLPEEGLPVEVAGAKKLTEDEVKKLFLEVDELLAGFTTPSYSIYDHDEQDNYDYSEEEDNQEDHEQANCMYASDSD